MAISATQMIDEQFRESCAITAAGMSGVRNYLVNTDIVDRAIFAPGLPAMFHSWSNANDLTRACKVCKIGEAERLGGKDTSGEGAAGSCRVPVYYDTPGARGSIVIPVPERVGDAWTEMRNGTENALAIYGLTNDGSVDPTRQINNGEGFSIEFGTLEYLVHVFYDLDGRGVGGGIDTDKLDELTYPSKVNKEDLIFPAFYRTTHRPKKKAGTVRYRSYEIQQCGLFLEVIHHLEIRSSFLYTYEVMDARGLPVGQSTFAQVYAEEDLSGLWPT